REAAFKGAATVLMRAADQVLDEQHVVVERGRKKQVGAVALPSLFNPVRTANGAHTVESLRPVGLRLTSLQKRTRGFQQPRIVIEIQRASQRVQPFKEDCAAR